MERYSFKPEIQDFIENTSVPYAVYQFIDKRVVTIALSAGFCKLFGYEDSAQAYYDMDHDMYKAVHPDDSGRIADAVVRFAVEGGAYEAIYRSKKLMSEGYRTIHAKGEHRLTETGARLAYVWYVDEGPYQEETEGQSLSHVMSNALHKESILKANQYDFLTGLPSMTYFFELAESARDGIINGGKVPVFLHMDLCGMKFFNTKNSFAEGDRLLRAFSRILNMTFHNENCCHVGADHFVAFTTEDGLEGKLERFLEECRHMNDGKSLPVHIGIYSNRMGLVPVSTACDRAKIACDSIKHIYSSCYNYYSPEVRDDAEKRQYILSNLDRAISERWITVYYQPIIRAVSGKVCDEEALARWIDPERGLLSPADFIPYLEEAGLIYKMDLYVLERVLEKMEYQKSAGLHIVPHSVNLSRSDFDACDVVEEVRRRVDASDISRHMITIEITESTLSSDFDFMKEQVRRFQSLGFPVWMDDFGSGYSSLDALQSIKFNLLKFDMSFMKKLDEGDNGRIVLTELMRMANSLGMDTVCEGVEKDDQVKFLYEIGCSKVQGYYFSKPIPIDEIMERYRYGRQIGYENPDESGYFDTIGRLNLYDLSVISKEEGDLHNAFSTTPMGLIEVKGDCTRFVRTNPAYREFVKRFFHFDLGFEGSSFAPYDSSFMENVVKTCCERGIPSFYDEQMPDGSVVHSFARRVGVDSVTGCTAVLIAVLSVTAPDEGTTYATIARALAADYYNIYYVDLDTEQFIEYTSPVGGEELAMERHGGHFFEVLQKDTMTRVYAEDRAAFLANFAKKRIIEELERQGVYAASYRIVENGEPFYVNMKITRMQCGKKIIIGISNIDAQMKQLEDEKKLLQEKAALGRIAALSPDYIVLYTVDPVTDRYTQYSPSYGLEKLGLARQGEDFFGDVVRDAPKVIAPEDMERHLRNLTKENMLRGIEKNGLFTHNYRMVINGKTIPASLKATMVEENDGKKIIIGVTNDETAELRHKLEETQKIRDLNQTITSLLDNMPGMTFTKDAETGVYLTCNRAFAEYAHKASPDEVAGLTDAEIFDAETARHFVEDDQLALSMNKPYIFFEDVPDAVGDQRQFQTTKFKYVDATGRLCLQGICQDVTDMVRIQRENATTKEAYEKASNTAAIYNHIAHALARGCTDLFYVNMETNELIEFHTDDERGVLSEARRGMDFFEGCERDAKIYLYPEDQEKFIKAMNRTFLTQALDGGRVFELTYRIMKDGEPLYVQMNISRMEDDPRIIVIAVSDIDELMRQRRMEERVQEERIIYARLHAITGNFIVVYVVDPKTSRYREFDATNGYVESFGREKEGVDFFSSVRRDARIFAHPKDLDSFLSVFTKENVLAEVEKSGIFTWGYRLIMEGKPVHVQMKAAMVEEKDGPRLIVGLNDIDAQVRQEEEFGRRLMEAQMQANIDGLTGVKNKHAYLEIETQMDRQIESRRQTPFAIVLFDVNDLKKVNDTAGHQAGDQYLRDACKVICDIFKHSPVFRVGGDEFAVIAQGNDYDHMEELLGLMTAHNEEARRDGGIVIACGMSKFENNECVATVFERADHKMYENKTRLKGGEVDRASENR